MGLIFLKNNIVFLIKQSGYTLKTIKINNVGNSTLEYIVYKETSDPKLSTLLNIKNHFNISMDDLILKDLSKNNDD